jgi:hypothetical protein
MTFQITTPTGGSDSLNFKNFSGTSIGSIAAADGANNALTVTTGSAGSTAVVFDNNQNTTVNYLSAQNTFGFKNRIINGAMVIDQRNSGASVSTSSGSSIYSVDRWKLVYTQTNKYTAQQNAGSVTPPVGFVNYLGITSSSAYTPVAADYFQITQAIEGLNIADLGWGTVNAKTVTFSFWAYSSLTGTFGGCLNNANGNYNYPFTYTISSANTWTQISVTIVGPTAGSWNTNNNGGIYVNFNLAVGSTYTGTANAWNSGSAQNPTGATNILGTNGATFYITGVQLEKGNIATPFEYRQYGQELALCQRYFYSILCQVAGGYLITSGQCYSTSQAQLQQLHIVPMRAIPSFSIVGTPTLLNSTTGRTGSIISSSVVSMSTNALSIAAAVSGTPLAVGNMTSLVGSGTSATDGIQVSAEL